MHLMCIYVGVGQKRSTIAQFSVNSNSRTR